MADSYRLIVLKRLAAWIEGVTPANGYENDLTGRVDRGRATYGDEVSYPRVSILEPLNPDRDAFEAGEGQMSAEDWILLVQGWTPIDASDPNPMHYVDEAHVLMAEVKKRVMQLVDPSASHETNPQANLGWMVAGLTVEPGTVRQSDFPGSKGMFYIRVVLKIAEDRRDPFAVPNNAT